MKHHIFQDGQVQLNGTKCLDVINGVNADGTKLQIWDCEINTAVNQQFIYTAFGDNQWVNLHGWAMETGVTDTIASLTWTNSGKCLDLTNGNLSDGNEVQIWDCNGAEDNNDQIWDTGYM